MAAKSTDALIPLCHPLPLDAVRVDFRPGGNELAGADGQGAAEQAMACLQIEAEVTVSARTGAEMEALSAVSVAALTIYDMCKAIDRAMEVTRIRLVAKDGGRSGSYRREGEAAWTKES